MLRDTLKKHGVVGKTAQDICGEFSFDLAMLFDQGELDAEGKGYRPCVAFTADEEVFYVQPTGIEYHQYAFGTTADSQCETFEMNRINTPQFRVELINRVKSAFRGCVPSSLTPQAPA